MSKKVTIGHCIYCPNIENNVLSREHVIARGLGGLNNKGRMSIAYRASCSECAKKTGAMERDIMDLMFDIIRPQNDIQQSEPSKNPLPTEHPLEFIRNGIVVTKPIPIGEYPCVAIMPIFERPTYWIDVEPHKHLLTRTDYAVLEFIPKTSSLEEGTPYHVRLSHHDDMFGRMICKIAHSYAYFVGYGVRLDPFLRGYIVDDAPYTKTHIGGSPTSIRSNDLHAVNHFEEVIRGERHLIVRVRLFAQYEKSPTYEVIVGKVRAAYKNP